MEAKGSDLVTVSCADHGQYVSIALRNLFDLKRGTDFDFRYGQKSVRAHRVILELFLAPEVIGSNLGRQDASVKQEVSDAEEGCCRSSLDVLMEFLYKGEVVVPEGQLDELLGMARKLDFQMLADAIALSGSSKNNKVADVQQVRLDEPLDCSEKADKSVRSAKRSLERAGKADSSQFGVKKVRTKNKMAELVSPLLYLSQKFGMPQMGHFMEYGGSDAVPGCSNAQQLDSPADTVKGLLEDGSGDEQAAIEEAVAASVGLVQLQYSDHEDESNGPCDDSFHPGMMDFGGNLEMRVGGTPIALLKGRGAMRLYKCSHCDFQTTKYKQYYDHHPSAHGLTIRGEPVQKPVTRLYKCSHCDLETTDYRRYYSHLLLVHGLTVRGEPAPKHKCPECDFSSYLLNKTKIHQRNCHTKERPFGCQHCNYVGKQELHLKRHMNVVHGLGDSRFTCETCGRRCDSRAGLERHNRIHTNEKPFKCSHCSYATNEKMNLKRHVLTLH